MNLEDVKGSSLVLQNHVVSVQEIEGKLIITVYAYYKTNEQKQFGGLTIGRRLHSYELVI